ncbi:sterol carrier family protein [Parafrankia discariae]|uniref:sterol carrier family protein n=1 Tax=Parafrankia discariae TaxID=365528 RepID=UPI0003781176|nr:sterol carrier family protein [Parafrankia discariae]
MTRGDGRDGGPRDGGARGRAGRGGPARRGGRGGAAGFDPALPGALEEQWKAISDRLDGLPDEAFAAPSALPGWTTAELVTHIAHSALALSAALRADPAPDPAGGPAPEAVRAAFRAAVTAAAADLARVPPDGIADRPVITPGGPPSLGEFLLTRVVEAVVHGLDLGVPPARPALKAVVRLFTSTLAQRAPGHAVELRVPPFAAVQIVEGPRHTRGTPPNVVEADPAAFVLVATGRLAWGTALADGRIRASGERADLRFLLPLLT